ncbi:hypothetical protein LTR66_000670 [Elasticomyces elasticus]|nr:hypothetical protein LTR66_000670 [Elasticomyces elasticus]
MFSPLAFPNGSLHYDLATALPSASQSALSPFELSREPMMVLGIIDAAEYASPLSQQPQDLQGFITASELNSAPDFKGIHAGIREQYPKALVRQLLIFDYHPESHSVKPPPDTVCIPPVLYAPATALKTVMCDISALLLSEMSIYAKALQVLPGVQSPVAGQGGRAANSYQDVSRNNLVRGAESRSSSPNSNANTSVLSYFTPAENQVRPGTINDSRPSSPSSGVVAPLRTSDTVSPINASDDPSRSASRSSSVGKPRELSRDRTSVQSFGAGSANERARNRGKGRVGIVVGSLHLLAGRWPDALRELVEATNRARAFSDYLWHAKGLELIVVCLILHAWAGLDFQIPAICYPVGLEKLRSATSSHQIPPKSAADVRSTSSPTTDAGRIKARRSLTIVMPDLVYNILGIYARSAEVGGEILSQIALAECTIRLAKILVVIRGSKDCLDDTGLQCLVVGNVLQSTSSNPNSVGRPSKRAVADLLLAALPTTDSVLSTEESVHIHAGIASVLSVLGLERKRAVVLKELVSVLVPAMFTARKLGAAEMGIHPAAGFAVLGSLNADSGPSSPQDLDQFGLQGLLNALGNVHGLPDHEDLDQSSLVAATKDHNSPVYSGSVNLKLEVIRACISFSEAVPDLPGLVHFSALLLRTAGPVGVYSSVNLDAHVSLTKEEQERAITNISHAVGAAEKLNLPNTETEYWDKFLVRDIRLKESLGTPTSAMRRKSRLVADLDTEVERSKGPFLFDAFARRRETQTGENVILVGEPAEFVISLQNPFHAEIEIESLGFEAPTVGLSAFARNIILGRNCIQDVMIIGTARTTGSPIISACTVKIRGCHRRDFPFYRTPWSPDLQIPIKDIGIAAASSESGKHVVGNVEIAGTMHLNSDVFPQRSTYSLTVAPAQPTLVAHGAPHPESALMLLEGETKTVSITLRNISSTTPVDYIHIATRDSTTDLVNDTMAGKELAKTDAYELERQLLDHPVMAWRRTDLPDSQTIRPGGTAQYAVEVFGQPGLTDATILVDFANGGAAADNDSDTLYTRQVSVPFKVTVNASIQLHHVDVIPFPNDFAWSNWHRHRLTSSSGTEGRSHAKRLSSRPTEADPARFKALLDRVGIGAEDQEYCLFLVDLRNAWPNPLVVSLDVRDDQSQNDDTIDEWRRAYTVHEAVHPGHIARLVLLLPRMYISDPHARKPMVSGQNDRQFVVSSDKLSLAADHMALEEYWYREEILKRVRGVWKEEGTGRSGAIDLRNARLNKRMLHNIRLQDVEIYLQVFFAGSSGDKSRSDATSPQIGPSTFSLEIDRTYILRATVLNRSPQAIRPMLRLQPDVSHGLSNALPELEKRLSWSGLLQQALPLLHSRQRTEVEVEICSLCFGDYEIGASVEELEAVNGMNPRLWHAQSSCKLVCRP